MRSETPISIINPPVKSAYSTFSKCALSGKADALTTRMIKQDGLEILDKTLGKIELRREGYIPRGLPRSGFC